MSLYYISQTSDGWLKVKLVSGEIISLPYGLKVKRSELTGGREYFEILEGVNKGKVASVQSLPGNSYLTVQLKHLPPAKVTLDLNQQTLHVAGLGPCNAFSGGGHRGFTRIDPGSYLLAIPAYPSGQTRVAYNHWTKFHNTWFRIGIATTGSRFLPAGVISEGCVTVRQFIYNPKDGGSPPPGFPDLVELAKTDPGLLGLPLPLKPAPVVGWDKVYESLILCRLNDQAVGTLVVT